MNRFGTPFALAALLVVLAGAALAQQAVPERIAPAAAAKAATPQGPGASTAAFKAVDDAMMQAMNRPMTGDADQDFVAGMLPHHQGAVDMAKIELLHGKDPELRRLAHEIVAAQEKEIALMRTWQSRHPLAK